MELTDLEQQRLEKLQRLQARGLHPYPNRVDRTHTIAEAVAALEQAEDANEPPPSVAVTGRLRSIRTMGKISFADIEDGTGAIQLFLRVDELDDETYEAFKDDFDLGDFVEARGPLMRTRTGEISVLPRHLRIISKAISPLPVIKEQEIDGGTVRYTSFSDVEERYRQRYADLASN
ncbi:MAG: OB-fold nucleic acid binding domain-containing protein, partial [Chloroflexota bacterium]